MVQAGHPPPEGDAQNYLKVAHQCLRQARNSVDPDTAYADCVRRSEIAVDPILPDETE